MSGIVLTPPPYTGEDIRQIYSYLYTMHEELQASLNHLTADNFAKETAQAITELADGGIEKQTMQTISRQTDALRSLIIKTSDTIDAQMEALRETLESSYVAQSEFGTYKEQAQNQLEATATGIVQNFTYNSETTPLQEGMVSFSSYMTQTKAYIKTGLLYVDAGIPVYGVAVGQDLARAVYELDGEPVEGIQQGAAMAMFTANELSFWNQNSKIATFSNQELRISRATVERSFTIGNCRAVVEGSLIRWVAV